MTVSELIEKLKSVPQDYTIHSIRYLGDECYSLIDDEDIDVYHENKAVYI